MRLHLTPISLKNTYSSFNSHFIPPVKHSSILQLRKATQIQPETNEENNFFQMIKPYTKNGNQKYLTKENNRISEEKKPLKIKKIANETLVRKRKISDPIIEIPTKDSQEDFFSIGDKIESNDQNTKQFFKKEPKFILKIERKSTDVLSIWDFGYLDFFTCEVIGPQEQVEKMKECGIFVPIEMSKAAKKPFSVDDILIVDSPFHIIPDSDPPILISPVVYHSPDLCNKYIENT